jgi:hypothetical protein
MKLLSRMSLCLLLGAVAHAQLNVSFEPPEYVGSGAGTLLTGQQDWYNPVAGSNDWNVHTYAGNIYGLPADPDGQTQFVAGLSLGGTAYARAQHAFDWSAFDEWMITYDILTQYRGAPPATDNIGSFSLQPSDVGNYLQSLYQFEDQTTPRYWKSGFLTLENPAVGYVPGDAWHNLLFNRWYRESMTFSFDTQLITKISIRDLTTQVTTTMDLNQHLIAPAGVMPTGFRFFTGGTTAGNLTAYDNLIIIPKLAGDLNCDGRVDNFDITPFVLALTATPPDYAEYYAVYPTCDIMNGDINGDGSVDNFDITPFVALLTGG